MDDFLGWMVALIVAGSIFGAFKEPFSGHDFAWPEIWRGFLKGLLFIPYLLLAIVLHVVSDFKNHKAGYIVLFLVIGFITFTFYMGYQAGPSDPGSYDY